MIAKMTIVKITVLAVASARLLLVATETHSYAQVEPAAARSALVFSTYFGGGKRNWREQTYGNGIAVDKQGYVYVTGKTQARDFPSVNPAQKRYGGGGNDAFVAKLTPDGQKLVYSTVLGGIFVDFAERVAVDDSGNAYIAGTTYSFNFPTTPHAAQRIFGGGDRDGFVAKFSPDGKLVYSTLLGGDGTDRCTAIDVDGAGNAYVTGSTNSRKFAALKGTPSEHPRKDWDVLVAKLDPTGSKFTYVVRFGGTAGVAPRLGGFGDEAGTGIKVGNNNTVYVVGHTDSIDFPIRNSLQSKFGGLSDGFVVRLGATGADLLASTYLGGAGNDRVSAVALDALGNVSVTGTTDLSSAFVTRLNVGLTEMKYSTDLGDRLSVRSSDIAIDSLGNTYIIGTTGSSFPLVNPLFMPQPTSRPAFVIKLAPDGRKVVFSTLLGNPCGNEGTGIAVDSLGDIYVIGTTGFCGGRNLTADFPTVRALQPERINASFQTFISKITTR